MSAPAGPSPTPSSRRPLLLGLALAAALATACAGGAAPEDGGDGGGGGPGPTADAGPTTPGTTDTDADGLSDADEQRFGTSIHVADTDGDGFSDRQEVNDLGFDPASNNFLFNPRIADVPRLRVRLTSMPDFYVNLKTSGGQTRSVNTSYSDTSTTGTTRAWGGSQTQAVEMTHTAGVSVDVQHEFGITGGTSIGVSLSYEFSHSTRNETSTNWSSEQRAEHSHTLQEAEGLESSQGYAVEGGNLRTTVEVENAGDVAFRLENLTLSAYAHNPENPLALRPLGNLTYTGGAEPTVTLSPGARRSALNFNALLDEPTIRDLLRDSRNLVISPATYTLTGPNGEDLQLKETNVSARTAHVVIDFGLTRPQEVYRVSTIRERDNPGLPVRELLESVLRIPYATGTFPWRYGAEVRATHAGLVRLRDVAANNDTSSYWIVAHTYKTQEGAATETDYHNLLLAPYALETLKLQKGDVLHFVYVQDQDRDGLGDRSELVYGTDPNDPDTDDDGAADSLEVGGWKITEGGVEKVVRPDPLDRDTDDDGKTDHEEYLAVPKTNPLDRPANQRPVVSSVVRAGTGLDATLTVTASDSDFQDRVASVRVAWGDGATTTHAVAAGQPGVVATHRYARTGTFALSVVALDTHGLESAAYPLTVVVSMPTEGLLAHYAFDQSADAAVGGAARNGTFTNARYAAARAASRSQSADLREVNDTYGLFSAPHVPATVSFTYSIWVRGGSTSNRERLFGQGGWFSLLFDGTAPNGSTRVSFGTVTGDEPSAANKVSLADHPADAWVHYAAVVAGDAANNRTVIRLYRDGGTPAVRELPGVLFTNPGSCRFYVGGISNTDNTCTGTQAPNYNAPGPSLLADDLRIYTRALTDAEVAILATEGRP